MTTLSLVVPTIGQPDSTEDVKLNNALTAIATWANGGNIDTSNLASSAGITAAQLASALNGAWTTYTPTWTAASVNPAIGNGFLTGKYWQLGKTVALRIYMLSGSTTTYGSGAWSFALPGAVGAGTLEVLSAAMDISGTVYAGTSIINATSVTTTSPFAANAQVTATSPAAWAASSFILIQGICEVV